jgi:hypothetical protein
MPHKDCTARWLRIAARRGSPAVGGVTSGRAACLTMPKLVPWRKPRSHLRAGAHIISSSKRARRPRCNDAGRLVS